MQESGVYQSAVDQSVLKKIWNNMTNEGGVERRRMEGEKRKVLSEKLLVETVASCSALLC